MIMVEREGEATFPLKLFRFLSKAEGNEIISWTPDGLGFEIYQPERLVNEILPVMFNRKHFFPFFDKTF